MTNEPRPAESGQPSEEEGVSKAVELLRPLLRDPALASTAAAQIMAVTELFSGPMPPPGHFKAYEEAVPGSGKDIISMAMRAQRHRQRTETLLTLYPYFGLAAGFLAFAGCIIGACYLAINGHNAVAGLMLGVPTLGVIGWFIDSRVAPNNQAGSSPKAGTQKR
jgi:uncharacterized membrane protein